ncbi:MAG: Fe-S-containing hydro-lyase [Clostridiales Family XIII bacterium]|nr:Fe-S-containing hydro-lyase [Clostridiales Family XIII bacterium]
MTKIKHVAAPLSDKNVLDLVCGDMVYLSGVIYTARDVAHKRMLQAMDEGLDLPFDINGQVLYYVGPCPARPPRPFGSCGPTTSFRMDAYTPALLDRGLRGMIGKGRRSQYVVDSMKKNAAVYFAAIGGAGAAISRTVKKAEIVAYEDLGPEAVYKLEIVDFPCIVAIDSAGADLYEFGPELYRK